MQLQLLVLFSSPATLGKPPVDIYGILLVTTQFLAIIAVATNVYVKCSLVWCKIPIREITNYPATDVLHVCYSDRR